MAKAKILILQHDVAHYLSNAKDFVGELVDILGEESNGEYFSLGLRGGYKPELNKAKLKPSILNLDEQDDHVLSGTSCISFVSDWDDASGNDIKKGFIKGISQILDMHYGDTDYISIVKGQHDTGEIHNDINEVILCDAKVIAYIKR